MNSFNHHAYGAVADWLYGAAGGIRPGKPGYETVIFAPVPDRRLQSFEAELHTPHGICKSAWTWQDGAAQFEVSTPVDAEIRLHGISRRVAPGMYQFAAEQFVSGAFTDI